MSDCFLSSLFLRFHFLPMYDFNLLLLFLGRLGSSVAYGLLLTTVTGVRFSSGNHSTTSGNELIKMKSLTGFSANEGLLVRLFSL